MVQGKRGLVLARAADQWDEQTMLLGRGAISQIRIGAWRRLIRPSHWRRGNTRLFMMTPPFSHSPLSTAAAVPLADLGHFRLPALQNEALVSWLAVDDRP